MGEADPNLPMLWVKKLMHFTNSFVEILQDTFDPFAKKLSYRGQLQIPPFLHKKIYTKLLFKLMNLPADRRLCHVQLFRRLCNMFLLSHF
jgi:hypothetical protein